jgi:hypothetical protein
MPFTVIDDLASSGSESRTQSTSYLDALLHDSMLGHLIDLCNDISTALSQSCIKTKFTALLLANYVPNCCNDTPRFSYDILHSCRSFHGYAFGCIYRLHQL